ncbi:MAG: phage tail sheath family protein, partial [Rhizobiaceae bacterium]
MPGATTDFVGVRVFTDLTGTLARIDTRDSTIIGMTGPMPLADAGTFPLNTRVRFATDDAAKVLAMGASLMQDAIKQIGSEGIVTT